MTSCSSVYDIEPVVLYCHCRSGSRGVSDGASVYYALPKIRHTACKRLLTSFLLREIFVSFCSCTEPSGWQSSQRLRQLDQRRPRLSALGNQLVRPALPRMPRLALLVPAATTAALGYLRLLTDHLFREAGMRDRSDSLWKVPGELCERERPHDIP